METRIRVRVTPRAASDQIAGWQDDVLRVRVAAPPVQGRANEAVARLLAGALGLPRGAVRIASGHAAREKLVAIDGLTAEEARRRLEAPGPAR